MAKSSKEQANEQTKTPNAVPVNKPSKKAVKEMPTLGGSYQRDPATGALTLIERSEPTPPRANSIKKEGK